MEALRQALATIRKQVGQLSASSRLLMGSLVVILLMTLGFVALYNGRPSMVPMLQGYPAEDQQRAAAFLTTSGVPSEIRADGTLYVSAEREAQARAMLAENGKLPGDKTVMFGNLLEKQSWINSRQQNEQIFLIALQNQLAADIGQFRGIRRATVILDIPESQGLGRSVRRPSASATVTTDGRGLSQATVDAIAGYIAGSRSGLEIDRVRVIDATTGQQRKASSEGDQIPTTYLEHASKVEGLTQEKISNLLSFIPGVIVAVTAQVDVTRVTKERTETLPKGAGSEAFIRSSTEDTTQTSEQGKGAEPGLRSNVSAEISTAEAGPGSSSKTSKSTTEFSVAPGTVRETVQDPKGMTTMVGVSVNIPRSFVQSILGGGKDSGATGSGASGSAPDEAALAAKFDQDVRPQIESLIRPHVRVMTAQANKALTDQQLEELVKQSLSVAMIPLDVPATVVPQSAGILGTLAGGGGGGFSLGGGLIEKGVVGLLAVVAVGMMLMMVKKAGKKVDMPTAEELVGLPPQLETASDLIGEADEGDAAMAGIEVDEKQVQVQKVLEQVGALVDEKPDAAAKLLNRWVQPQD